MSSRRIDTKRAILEATRRVLEDSHGDRFRVEDVARVAGVSRQAVYLHFGSRTGLLVSLAHHVEETQPFTQEAERVRGAPTAAGALDAFIDFWASYFASIERVALSVMALRHTDEAAATAWEDRTQNRYRVCSHLIGRLHEEGKLAPEWSRRDAAEMLWALLSIPVWENLTVDRKWSKARYRRRLKSLIRSTFVRD